MALASMTGFARSEGEYKQTRWVWELRSVNGKGLDVRMRLPQGFDALEVQARALFSKAFKRGNITANLQIQREQGDNTLAINEEALDQVLKAVELLKARMPDASAPSIDGILAHKGVLELKEPEESEEDKTRIAEGILASLSDAVDGLQAMRQTEGAAVGGLLISQVDEIARLTKQAEELPSRQTDVIRARLAKQIEELLEASSKLDEQRLHQEAALLATKADVREEIDRLIAHVAAVRELAQAGGPIGRRLDFLAQEFNREANTLCSKSNSVELTTIGLELKTVIDQMREQIQNLE
ncbi:YicC family protein [Rhodobacteraceae bacterium RKSG542]|uniref:YicC/YloC family endoribonuclease n=1 Tax=Pseudovibrio flavus TaxID=2529854 RepID=UPI0012BD20E0|nr:YicC/YloC family endoribonuclease [Pseudovibrio flavus]MTI17612.1 YicC family protein [Pseudovibrio flavus]